MAEAARKIEIFEPFGRAIDLTKLILFQPFNFTKWLVIAFAAFLAGLVDGTRMGFPSNFGGGDFKGERSGNQFSALQEEIMPWLVTGVIATVAVVIVVMIVLFMWLGSRGRFMFIDCIVRNRGAIEEPWREYRREGNSLFLLSLAVGAGSLLIVALLALPIFFPYFQAGEFGDFGIGRVLYVIAAALFLMLIGFVWMIAVWFMAPVMYRQRCNATTAFLRVMQLIRSFPVPMILFALFGVVLSIAGAMISCVVTCVTCCVAAFPYVGTVVLLPLYTFYYSYTLLFLRQFGPEYDAWANVGVIEQIAPGTEPPSPAPTEPPLPPAPPPLQS
jgi:hypothetical protein